MDFNKLTTKSQEAIAAAQDLARRRGNPEITPEHLLLALLDQELFAGWQGLRADAERKVSALPTVQGGQQQPAVSPAFSRTLDKADAERQALGDDYVSTEHLFLSIEPVPRGEIVACVRDALLSACSRAIFPKARAAASTWSARAARASHASPAPRAFRRTPATWG